MKRYIMVALLCLILSPRLSADEASHRVAVEELLKQMQAERIMLDQTESMKKMMSSMRAGSPTSKEAQEVIEKYQGKIMDLVQKKVGWDVVKDDLVRIYMETFTEPEIKELTAFYKTPIGQKVVATTPDVTRKTMEMTQKRMMALMPEIQALSKEMAAEMMKAIVASKTNAVASATATNSAPSAIPPPPAPAPAR